MLCDKCYSRGLCEIINSWKCLICGDFLASRFTVNRRISRNFVYVAFQCAADYESGFLFKGFAFKWIKKYCCTVKQNISRTNISIWSFKVRVYHDCEILRWRSHFSFWRKRELWNRVDLSCEKLSIELWKRTDWTVKEEFEL